MSPAQKEKSLWAEKGFEVAWEQFKIPIKSRTSNTFIENNNNKITMDDTDSALTITGEIGSIIFNKKYGIITSMVHNNKNFLINDNDCPGGPRLNVYRAPLDSDVGIKIDWKKPGRLADRIG